jgi:hypothetical protein
VAVIAEPGERKTPVHAAFTAPLYAAQHTIAERAKPLLAEHGARKDIAARQAEQAKTVAATADPDRRDDLTAEALAAKAITLPELPSCSPMTRLRNTWCR